MEGMHANLAPPAFQTEGCTVWYNWPTSALRESRCLKLVVCAYGVGVELSDASTKADPWVARCELCCVAIAS